ncbi:hypothetical protein [Chelativorans salis]|uniref:Uncharacterized protein n=1 Tax=Chelativorans salis TaxID=2978478 RepID=A0ABT2LTL1_9HYPH|nr:hypothetical protein [Chelativorans sp. EGI FJ00035]MCT7377187.1 hypothetical protein [Chelativorans sp. EGI FJ00035]
MGMILTGIVVAIAIAIGTGYFMNLEQRPSWQVYSTQSTRVGDPGHNLVGATWTGNPGNDAVAAAEPEEPPS